MATGLEVLTLVQDKHVLNTVHLREVSASLLYCNEFARLLPKWQWLFVPAISHYNLMPTLLSDITLAPF